ncbi:MAG: membrane dipeptidase [Phycisphaerales bacterium]|nr:membrane dipeptidase [Phycisphaerales bacterium]
MISNAWLDAHLDLAYLAGEGRDFNRSVAELEIDGSVTWPDLAAARIETLFATIFTERDGPPGEPAAYPSDDPDAAERAGRRQLDWYEAEEAAGRVAIVRSLEDLDSEITPRLVLLMECADPIKTPEAVAWWTERGLRVVGLSWARGSRYAGGNARPGGLNSAGEGLVDALEEHGVGHDVSHLSPAAFDDLLARTSGPVCATHSNAAAITGPNDRHLRDDQIQAIADRDGVIGLNLFGRFLRSDSEPATIDDFLDHVEHVAALAGRHRVGLGSDADGGFGASSLPEGLRDLRQLDRLTAGLADRGWSETETHGFQSENWNAWLKRLLTPCR